MIDWVAVLITFVLVGTLMFLIEGYFAKKRINRESEYFQAKIEELTGLIERRCSSIREHQLEDRRYIAEQLKMINVDDYAAVVSRINNRLDKLERKPGKK